MKLLLLMPLVYVMGFLTAIPIGATQIEIAKRSLNGYVPQAMMVVLGSVISDVMYGFIAMFGFAPFLHNRKVEAIFWLAGAGILAILGIFTITRHGSRKEIKVKDVLLEDYGLSLFVGFSLAVINPPMMLWWLVCASFVKSLGLVQSYNAVSSSLFLLAGGLGIASYLTVLALALKKAGRFITPKLEHRITVFLGAVLLLLSIYFLVRFIMVFV
ncbi:MAG: LysE family transporter [Deltaproteobacteria bacterium]|nr:LysE family transporter [Deltaproteobacteria bacterium]